MNAQSYLIDTNIIIGLEDDHMVKPVYARFSQLAAKHNVKVLVHEASFDDIRRDKDTCRRRKSLSKIKKYELLRKVSGLKNSDLKKDFGCINNNNDMVDAILLHALSIKAADFLVTEDQGLHKRAERHCTNIASRVMYIADAEQNITTTYEPNEVPLRYVKETSTNTILSSDKFFNSLRKTYPEFNDWWRNKCNRERRSCWVVYDKDELAGLIVRKDESGDDTDAIQKSNKILKLCLFKISSEKLGIKLGELLLKKALWFAQKNKYDLAYITTYTEQNMLIDLLEFYGFQKTTTKDNGEIVLERTFSNEKLKRETNIRVYETDRKNYPRFIADENVKGFVIPIKEVYHDILYPDLRKPKQLDMFRDTGPNARPDRPSNTIRKVYLCRSPSNLSEAGSVLFFYKGKSEEDPSQALTAVGILEDVAQATSTKEMMRLTGGRSVYSERDLEKYKATGDKPVKVINYLLIHYIDPPISLEKLCNTDIFSNRPPQSIAELRGPKLSEALRLCNFCFKL